VRSVPLSQLLQSGTAGQLTFLRTALRDSIGTVCAFSTEHQWLERKGCGTTLGHLKKMMPAKKNVHHDRIGAELADPTAELTPAQLNLFVYGSPEQKAASHAAVDNDDFAAAILEAPSSLPLFVEVHLTRVTRVFIPRSVVAARIKASPRLQRVQREVEEIEALEEGAIIAEFLASKQIAKVHREERKKSRAETRERRQMRRLRKDAAPCGAQTRAGQPCQRKPVPGKLRCTNHSGLTPTRPGPG
jgi:hypothetical protein